MNKLLSLLLLISPLSSSLSLAASPPSPLASTDWRAIRFALGQIETGDRDHATGPAGEVSRYQIMPAVWKAKAPSRANPIDPDQAWAVARAELTRRIADYQRATTHAATPEAIYLLWNAPRALALAGYRSDRVNATLRDRAERFGNLVRDFNTPKPKH